MNEGCRNEKYMKWASTNTGAETPTKPLPFIFTRRNNLHTVKY